MTLPTIADFAVSPPGSYLLGVMIGFALGLVTGAVAYHYRLAKARARADVLETLLQAEKIRIAQRTADLDDLNEKINVLEGKLMGIANHGRSRAGH